MGPLTLPQPLCAVGVRVLDVCPLQTQPSRGRKLISFKRETRLQVLHTLEQSTEVPRRGGTGGSLVVFPERARGERSSRGYTASEPETSPQAPG